VAPFATTRVPPGFLATTLPETVPRPLASASGTSAMSVAADLRVGGLPAASAMLIGMATRGAFGKVA
jgi:hypothetical protein